MYFEKLVSGLVGQTIMSARFKQGALQITPGGLETAARRQDCLLHSVASNGRARSPELTR